MGTENQKSSLFGLTAGQAIGIGAADAGFGFLGNLAMSSIENARYRENQEQNFELAQQAQRAAGTNQKIALENAGISPAVMNGETFQTATPNQAPLQNKSANMSFMGAALQAQQMDLLRAQTEQQDIINERMREEDKGTDIGMREQFQNISEAFRKVGFTYAAEIYDSMSSSPTAFNSGSLVAWEKTNRMFTHLSEASRDKLQADFSAQVADKKLTNSAAIEAESLFGAATYDKIRSEIAKLEVDKLVSITEAGKNSAQIKLIGQQINEAIAHITQMLASAQLDDATALQRYHSDFASMIKNGDYGAAAVSLTAGIVQEIIPAITTKGVSTAIKGAKEADKEANRPRNYAFPSQSSDHE